jgi:hypothetical protein
MTTSMRISIGLALWWIQSKTNTALITKSSIGGASILCELVKIQNVQLAI